MNDNPTLLSYEARQVMTRRVRAATEARTARGVRGVRGTRRHRLAQQLRSVAERLDA